MGDAESDLSVSALLSAMLIPRYHPPMNDNTTYLDDTNYGGKVMRTVEQRDEVKEAAKKLRAKHGGNGWDALAAKRNAKKSLGSRRAFWQAVHDKITERETIDRKFLGLPPVNKIHLPGPS